MQSQFGPENARHLLQHLIRASRRVEENRSAYANLSKVLEEIEAAQKSNRANLVLKTKLDALKESVQDVIDSEKQLRTRVDADNTPGQKERLAILEKRMSEYSDYINHSEAIKHESSGIIHRDIVNFENHLQKAGTKIPKERIESLKKRLEHLKNKI